MTDSARQQDPQAGQRGTAQGSEGKRWYLAEWEETHRWHGATGTTMVYKCMVWYGKKKRQNSSCPVDRGRSEVEKVVGIRQMRVA